MYTVTESERKAFRLNMSPYSAQLVVEEYSVSNLLQFKPLTVVTLQFVIEVIRLASYKVLSNFITEQILKIA